MENQRKHKAAQENVPGDFYVEDGCCTLCGVPEVEAPTLFGGFSEEEQKTGYGCYVKKQPETEKEHDQMITTMAVAELACVRYCGKNKDLIRKINELAGEGLSDHEEIITNDKNAIQHKSKSNSLWQQFINFIKP
jgi:hypothetical protein